MEERKVEERKFKDLPPKKRKFKTLVPEKLEV